METPFSQNRAKRPKRKVNLSQRFIDTVKPEPTRSLYWDTKQDCLALSVEPTGSKRFVLIYRFRGDGRFHGKVRWYTFPRGVGLSDARTLAQVKMGEVASGIDVQAIKTSPRNQITFQTLATRYVEEYAKANNRS